MNILVYISVIINFTSFCLENNVCIFCLCIWYDVTKAQVKSTFFNDDCLEEEEKKILKKKSTCKNNKFMLKYILINDVIFTPVFIMIYI